MKDRTGCPFCIAMVFVLGAASPALAQVLFDQPRTFVVTETCAAYSSIKKRKDPVSLQVEQGYPALGENRRDDASHATIEVEGKRKWVALTCGRYEGGGRVGLAPTPTPAPAPARPDPDCLPFFDDVHNPVSLRGFGKVDVTPPAPEIASFGHAVNDLCGDFGARVNREGFKSLLDAHPDILERIRDFAEGRVFPGRSAPTGAGGYLDDLAEAWFAAHGFGHIFCGERGREGSVGGLHFRGRYLQLQRDGVACRLSNNRDDEEVAPGVVYSVGVKIRANGRSAQSDRKGYGLTLGAEDILKLVTRAFAENPASGRSNQGCLLSVQDDGKRFKAVFVWRREGIRTFYPDATPDTSRNPACAAKIPLPPTAPADRSPVVAKPLGTHAAAVGELAEISIPADAFRDLGGAERTVSVTQADGGPLPGWADYDPTEQTLLFLPETGQVGTKLRIRITASDGHHSASDELVVEVVDEK